MLLWSVITVLKAVTAKCAACPTIFQNRNEKIMKNTLFKKITSAMKIAALSVAMITASPSNIEAASVLNAQAIPVVLNETMPYASFSVIHSGAAMLYVNQLPTANGITVCVNAGHGTKGGESRKTLSHPDGSPKVTGGTTSAGATQSTAVSSGMTFTDGVSEASVTLKEALILKGLLLNSGYNVLMIREGADVQLDNVARTVLANKYAQCHISLHWDSTASNKGAFYCKVPGNPSYKAMEPVRSTWAMSDLLGENLINGLRTAGRKIHGTGSMELDLTQTSYSTIPSVDIELGDKASDHSDAALNNIAMGLLTGINSYFGR